MREVLRWYIVVITSAGVLSDSGYQVSVHSDSKEKGVAEVLLFGMGVMRLKVEPRFAVRRYPEDVRRSVRWVQKFVQVQHGWWEARRGLKVLPNVVLTRTLNVDKFQVP